MSMVSNFWIREVFLQVRHFSTYAHGTQGSFSSDVGIRGLNQIFDFGEQVSGHLDRGNVAQCAQSQTDDILVGVVQIVLERVCDQRQDFLILIQ